MLHMLESQVPSILSCVGNRPIGHHEPSCHLRGLIDCLDLLMAPHPRWTEVARAARARVPLPAASAPSCPARIGRAFAGHRLLSLTPRGFASCLRDR
eukprot:12428569-Alexandrium_andersonii.AAC.1